jgi:hypothetical protein
MLQHMKLDHSFWEETMAIATYLQIWIFTKVVSSMTPKEVWCDNKPSISNLCFFCYVAFIHVPKEIRTKLNFKAIKCIFISYNEEIKRYKLENHVIHYVIISHDVIFYASNIFYGKTIGSNLNSRLKHLVSNWKLEMKDKRWKSSSKYGFK